MASSNIFSCMDNVLLEDNIIMMDVKNFLAGWPTYKVNFTPQNPGPVKLIIWLKDAVKLIPVEDLTDSGAELLLPCKPKGQKRTSSDCKDKIDATTDMNKLTHQFAALKVSSACSSNLAQAKPFSDDSDAPWPPHRRHTLRDIKSNEEISNFIMFRAFPAAIAAGEEVSTL
ncbi:hypothetical protein BDR07DRAFT_1490495 [Suillus spraguei]|nr:hypothetical protein BDR07DRAFT_1490495 [Suillus spraguei]